MNSNKSCLCICKRAFTSSPTSSSSFSSSTAFLRAASRPSQFPPQVRHDSTKASPPTVDRDVASTSQHSAFSDPIASDTVQSEADANSAGSTASPASPGAGAAVPKSGKAPRPTAWLASDEGRKYKRPLVGRTNWIGRTPFPLNPSFKPPTPISNVQKERIYKAFVAAVESSSSSPSSSTPSSETYHVRQLALKFGLSLDRIRAIVRLKSLERNLSSAGQELQMKYLSGMEQALGVSSGEYLPIKEAPDIALETASQYAVNRKTRYIMLDEENVDDVESVERELDNRQRRKSGKSSPTTLKGDEKKVKQDKVTRVLANDAKKTARRSEKVEIEYRDVPGRIDLARNG